MDQWVRTIKLCEDLQLKIRKFYSQLSVLRVETQCGERLLHYDENFNIFLITGQF